MTHLYIQATCTNTDCLLEGEPQRFSAPRKFYNESMPVTVRKHLRARHQPNGVNYE